MQSVHSSTIAYHELYMSWRRRALSLAFVRQMPCMPVFCEQRLWCKRGHSVFFFLFFPSLLQERLRVTLDERTANEIMEVLRRVRIRAASEGKGESPEIGEWVLSWRRVQCHFQRCGLAVEREDRWRASVAID